AGGGSAGGGAAGGGSAGGGSAGGGSAGGGAAGGGSAGGGSAGGGSAGGGSAGGGSAGGGSAGGGSGSTKPGGCAVNPVDPLESRARVMGYVMADGAIQLNASGDLYFLHIPAAGLADYIKAQIANASITGVTVQTPAGGGTTFVFPVASLGKLYLGERGTAFPYPVPASYESATVYPADFLGNCRIQQFLAAIIELDGAQGTTYPKTNQVIDDPHPKKRDAVRDAYLSLGASPVIVVGQSVVLEPADFKYAQCLPLRTTARAPGGAPPPGTCKP
ncbi:MAG: hypothetical protein K1X89_10650, partial [Myxococcaceae bacterium]|nr:hypothetical protein [Myxococcaceae bacterium]